MFLSYLGEHQTGVQQMLKTGEGGRDRSKHMVKRIRDVAKITGGSLKCEIPIKGI